MAANVGPPPPFYRSEWKANGGVPLQMILRLKVGPLQPCRSHRHDGHVVLTQPSNVLLAISVLPPVAMMGRSVHDEKKKRGAPPLHLYLNCF